MLRKLLGHSKDWQDKFWIIYYTKLIFNGVRPVSPPSHLKSVLKFFLHNFGTFLAAEIANESGKSNFYEKQLICRYCIPCTFRHSAVGLRLAELIDFTEGPLQKFFLMFYDNGVAVPGKIIISLSALLLDFGE